MPAKEVYHRNPDAIWLFDYPSLLAMDDCPEYQVWLSERDINIIFQATKNIDKFQSRVFTSAYRNTYTTVDEDEFSNFVVMVSDMNVHMGEYLVCNDLMQAIVDKLQAIVEKPCCPGSAGPFGGGTRGTFVSQEPPNSFEDTGSNYPSGLGFDNREDFDTHKCNVAADIIANLRHDLLGLAGLTIAVSIGVTGWVAVLVTILLTPIPFDDLAAIAFLLITTALSYGLMAELSADLGDAYETLICALYDANNSTDAKDNFRAAISEVISAEFSGSSIIFLENVMEHLVTQDAINKLFLNEPTQSQDADCSECGDEPAGPYTIISGIETSEPTGEANPIIITAVDDGEAESNCGTDGKTVRVEFGQPVTITEVTVIGAGCGACGSLDIYYYWDIPYTGLIQQGNGRPQDTAPVPGVMALQFFYDCDGVVPEVTITYTID